MTIVPLAPHPVKPTAIVGGYIRLTTRRYRGAGDPVEEPMFVRAESVQVVEACYAEHTDKLIGTRLSLPGGNRVHCLQSVEAVLALLEEAGDAGR